MISQLTIAEYEVFCNLIGSLLLAHSLIYIVEKNMMVIEENARVF